MTKYIATPSRTREIMDKYNLHTKKSLGQNFLVEPSILNKMIQTAEVDKDTTVIEIGPGIGALTEFLAINAGRVLAFEIDERFIEVLGDTLSVYDNVEVVHSDILEVDFSTPEYSWLNEVDKLIVVANLPYYITTPIITHLMKSDLPVDSLVMMMQKEVAERLTAPVGTKAYGSLSVAIQNYLEAEIAFIVPPTVFIPAPNVDSAVLKMIKRKEPLEVVEDDGAFQDFVKSCFVQRRKTIWNNLRQAYIKPGHLEEDVVREALEEAEINPSARAEALNVHEFARVYRLLFED